jgi:hypothetical protein
MGQNCDKGKQCDPRGGGHFLTLQKQQAKNRKCQSIEEQASPSIKPG